MTDNYKLYQDGNFFNFIENIDELDPAIDLSESEKKIKEDLQGLLDKAEGESAWEIEMADH